MLTAWHDKAHDEIGRSFAKRCKKTLASMHTDDGIYANADLITPDMVNGEQPSLAHLSCLNGTPMDTFRANSDCFNIFVRCAL